MNHTIVTYARSLLVVAALLGVSAHAGAVPPQWELVRQYSVPADEGCTDADNTPELIADGLDTGVRGGYLYVTLSRPATVRLYTVLGTLVSQRTLPAGVSRYRLQARGMYLLKTDRGTRRITY